VRGIMKENFLEIVDEAGNLNSKLFSLSRIKILWALSQLGEDGATARVTGQVPYKRSY